LSSGAMLHSILHFASYLTWYPFLCQRSFRHVKLQEPLCWLVSIDEEIQTLRQVLLAKCRRQQFLKRQLGITVISELRDEVTRGVDTIQIFCKNAHVTLAASNPPKKLRIIALILQ
uniref:DH domain-containing protein n=1 Tax=Echinostoma caproni TaxID=27848 RepID=A0A183B2F3_9TREM